MRTALIITAWARKAKEVRILKRVTSPFKLKSTIKIIS